MFSHPERSYKTNYLHWQLLWEISLIQNPITVEIGFQFIVASVLFCWNIHVSQYMKTRKLGFRWRNDPGIVNRTFRNRTQSNSIRGLSSIEFGNRTKSNTKFCLSSISELNRTNRTHSNSIHYIVFSLTMQVIEVFTGQAPGYTEVTRTSKNFLTLVLQKSRVRKSNVPFSSIVEFSISFAWRTQ